MTNDAAPPDPKPAAPRPSERDKRLAQALRANLRRRKAGAEPADKPGDESSS